MIVCVVLVDVCVLIFDELILSFDDGEVVWLFDVLCWLKVLGIVILFVMYFFE